MARKAARTRKVLKKDVAYCEGPGAGPSGSPLRTEGGLLETRLPSTSQPVPALPSLFTHASVNGENIFTHASVNGEKYL